MEETTPSPENHLAGMRKLSPKRNTTHASSAESLVAEQLAHFGIDADSPFGQILARITQRLYESQADLELLWNLTLKTIGELDRSDQIAYFNAKKFLSFQLAKLLDTAQNPSRRTYQALDYQLSTRATKGPYAVFDNVTAIFSATPVIARTATYIYACAEWIEDAFKGKELLLEIYSRLLNPTSISLANFIVDLEAGPHSNQYFAWNFSSGMAAIDGVLSHLLGRDDVLITSRNIYGGAHQLIYDWYAKEGNLEIAVEHFDGYEASDFSTRWSQVKKKYAERFAVGRKAYLYLESPSNPHGDVLDVPAICREAHEADIRVILDATVGTPFLVRPLQREDPAERPDFVIHSYTKDLSGTGTVIAGTVIGRTHDMFAPKGYEPDETAQSEGAKSWRDTMFWNVYFVKGAFLNADSAFEVIQGMRTLDMRMLAKCINTQILVRFLDTHPQINVHSHALDNHPNAALRKKLLFLGLPSPLFTIDIEHISSDAFHRFFDSLSPTFGHMISLGQSNTIVSCPALTTHSELDETALAEAGIRSTTIRFAIGDEHPLDLINHFLQSAKLSIDPTDPGFSDRFCAPSTIEAIVRDCYIEIHRRYIASVFVHQTVRGKEHLGG
ncbi:MAG: PLP-dependent aspartate aminotransferase family protein [Nitrospirales bacterium]